MSPNSGIITSSARETVPEQVTPTSYVPKESLQSEQFYDLKTLKSRSTHWNGQKVTVTKSKGNTPEPDNEQRRNQFGFIKTTEIFGD